MYVGCIAFNKHQSQVKTDSFVNSYSLVWASAMCLVSMTKTANWFVSSIVQFSFGPLRLAKIFREIRNSYMFRPMYSKQVFIFGRHLDWYQSFYRLSC